MRAKTFRVAIGGVLSALAVAILFLGSILPFSTFLAPVLAAVCVQYFVKEFGGKTALAVHATIALLAVLLVPDKELALLFAFVFGPYPIIKMLAERLRSRAASWLVKYACFNLGAVGIYLAMLHLITVAPVREELAEYTVWFIALLLLMANIFLFLYDRALDRIARIYISVILPKIRRGR